MADGWIDELRNVIRERWAVGERFSVEDVYDLSSRFAQLYPSNQHIRDKLRQTLQYLRDQGFLEFINDRGEYRRVGE